ncbi:hypothetical protein Vadar_016700 [Vaccinium darrowii]|uniref:Uncharacterized protein n=1 Tax=Vaccinium darrowii TaxID=229202 RepID=A0ACB7XAI7_9ERIC|nr:hypothetical protein Vadar_016700 [Vaccinium darrowii]
MLKFFFLCSDGLLVDFLGLVFSCLMAFLSKKFLGNEKWKLSQQQLPPTPLQRQQQQVRSSSKSTGSWRLNFLIWFAIGGVLFSAFLYWYIRRGDVSKRKETIANICDERAKMLQDQFNVNMNNVHALAIFVSTFHHGKEHSAIDRETFATYTESTTFQRPLTGGVAYALRVLHSEREEFEKKHGWMIKKMETEDQSLIQECNPENLDPSPPQDEYAPGASYDVPSLVEKLLHQLASKQIIVRVYDTTNKNEHIKMYGPDDVIDTGLLHISTLEFGDPARKHEMHCRFSQKPSPHWIAIMASGGALIITLLLVQIFNAARLRIAGVEHDCQEMMELKHRAEAADVAKSQEMGKKLRLWTQVQAKVRRPVQRAHRRISIQQESTPTLNANQRDFASTALVCGKDLISLINEVLDQAKIESGRLELEAIAFDLRAVLDNVLSLFFSGESREKCVEDNFALFLSEEGGFTFEVHFLEMG